MTFEGPAGSVILLEPDGAFLSFEPDAGLVGFFLNEQRDLSAVERFAQFHEDADEPLQGQYYSALMPAHPPGPGQQLAFEVDLDRCSGCKACVAACHNLNGLDEGESWRDVGLVIGGMPELPVLQHVTSACHHCLAPACLNACPVDAYEKDPHDPGLSGTSTINVSVASIARWPVPMMPWSITRPGGLSASATCAATGSRSAKRRRAFRPARTRRSASASWITRRSTGGPRRGASCRPRPTPPTHCRPHISGQAT